MTVSCTHCISYYPMLIHNMEGGGGGETYTLRLKSAKEMHEFWNKQFIKNENSTSVKEPKCQVHLLEKTIFSAIFQSCQRAATVKHFCNTPLLNISCLYDTVSAKDILLGKSDSPKINSIVLRYIHRKPVNNIAQHLSSCICLSSVSTELHTEIIQVTFLVHIFPVAQILYWCYI
jgi:hypothetical protein